jgi:hypothetical protein
VASCELKTSELIHTLTDPDVAALGGVTLDTEILLPAHEQFWDALDTLRIKKARRKKTGDRDYVGEYRVGDHGTSYVLLASSRRPDFAKGDGN